MNMIMVDCSCLNFKNVSQVFNWWHIGFSLSQVIIGQHAAFWYGRGFYRLTIDSKYMY